MTRHYFSKVQETSHLSRKQLGDKAAPGSDVWGLTMDPGPPWVFPMFFLHEWHESVEIRKILQMELVGFGSRRTHCLMNRGEPSHCLSILEATFSRYMMMVTMCASHSQNRVSDPRHLQAK